MVTDPHLNVIDEAGGRPALPGPDHAWFSWSACTARPPVSWPGGARVAVSVVLDLGAVEWELPGENVTVAPLGGRGIAPYPDVPRMSHREFGHRVGVFRLLQILSDLDIKPAAAIDVLTAERYPRLVDHLRPVVGEFLAGGLSASRPITSLMTPDEEHHYIDTTLNRLEAALGSRPAGWLGPEHSESERTPALLAEAGLVYVADWGNDEQPYSMAGAGRDFWAFPLSWELSDVNAFFLREVSPAVYARSLKDAFAVLRADGETSGRVLGIHLHPWLAGQAFRAGGIKEALAAVSGADAWIATPLEIVDWCRRNL
jgi:allantoinase